MIVKEEKGRDMVTDKTSGNLLTISDAARLLNVHVHTLRRWGNQGILSVRRIGPRGDRRFQRQEVESLVKELRENNGKRQTLL